MVQEINATFGELDKLVDTINETGSNMEGLLDDLARRLRSLTEMWEGAASEGFQNTLSQWFTSADDLRDVLRRLERIVRTTHANYRNALVTNARMWPAPRR